MSIRTNEQDVVSTQNHLWYVQRLTKKNIFWQILHNKSFLIDNNPKYDKCQHRIASMVYNFFDKKAKNTTHTRTETRPQIHQNRQLGNELHKLITRKFQGSNVHSSYRDRVWSADLVDVELINKLNTVVNFQLCVIDIHSKYDCVVPFKDKKCITITIPFEKKFWWVWS